MTPCPSPEPPEYAAGVHTVVLDLDTVPTGAPITHALLSLRPGWRQSPVPGSFRWVHHEGRAWLVARILVAPPVVIGKAKDGPITELDADKCAQLLAELEADYQAALAETAAGAPPTPPPEIPDKTQYLASGTEALLFTLPDWLAAEISDAQITMLTVAAHKKGTALTEDEALTLLGLG